MVGSLRVAETVEDAGLLLLVVLLLVVLLLP